jgi:hypothetical protein
VSLEIVGIGDLHFDKLDRVLPGIGNNLIAAEVRKPLDYALKHGVQHVFFYGDLADRAHLSYSGHAAFLRSVLHRKYQDLHKWIILGNHDWADTGHHSLLLLEIFAKHLKNRNLHIITNPTESGLDGVPVRFLPYPSEDTSKRCLNVGHFEVSGSIRDNGKKINSGYDKDHLCLMGHLHTPHKVRRTYFSGTLYQTNFGESLPKSFHHVKVMPDLRHKVVNVPNEPAFKLFNLEVHSRRDLAEISSNKYHLYKLFVQDGVRINPDDLSKYPNVIRINRFKDESDLKVQLDDEWKAVDESPNIFQPEEDLRLFLSSKTVHADLKDRVIKLHDRVVKEFLSQE